MSDELRELSALDALGALSPDERQELGEAAARTPELAEQMVMDRLLAGELGELLAPAVGSPPDLADRLVAAARASRPAIAQPSPAPRRHARWWNRIIPTVGIAAAAAAAAVAVTLVATRDPGLGQPDVEASLVEALPATASFSGRVALYRPDQSDGRISIDLTNFPRASEGHHYQVWVLKKDSTVMQAVTTFNVSGSSTHLVANLPSRGRYAAVDISLEDDDGPPEHSGTSIAGAKLSAS